MADTPKPAAKPPAITLDHIRRAVKTVDWLTPLDVGIALERENLFPPQDVFRAAPAPAGTVNPLAYGYGQLALVPLRSMANLGLAEAREDPQTGEEQYRMTQVNAAAGSRGLRVASADEVSRPGPTDSGITQMAIYRYVTDEPGITEDDLIDRLAPMWKPVPDLVKAYHAKNKHHEGLEVPAAPEDVTDVDRAEGARLGIEPGVHARLRLLADRAGSPSPERYLKRQILKNFASRASRGANSRVEAVVTIRYYMRRGPAGA